ncbi:helix-turn-helix domain-containing protein [Solicola sp. PLA-1-18]|uniref:helix-turn-helix domain-containing protein n=1 Tax=Solicola sp. PLA-1-18 TaxID=3380532 RepID=UPI003B81F873
MTAVSQGGVPHLAERLNDLFSRVPKPGTTQPYSNDAVASELTAQGVSVTGVYISQLRNGRKDNPSARLLAAIAVFFGVPIGYFFDAAEASTVVAQLDDLGRARDARIQGLMTRAQGMSDESLDHIASIIDHVVAIENGSTAGDTAESAED